MATAVETSSQPQPRTPNTPANLLFASVAGAVYVLAALAVVLYAVPSVWGQYVAPSLGGFSVADTGLRVLVQLAAFAALVWFGQSLAGANPPHGIRGGIFLVTTAVLGTFFLVRAAGLAFEGTAGQVIAGLLLAGLLFGAFKLFTSPRGERWMVGLEEQGWFHTSRYKPALGQKVRRLTVLGILLVGASGAYSLYSQGRLPVDWTLAIPFADTTFTVLKDANIVIPVLLFALALWVAVRITNMPTFAEFLIATEAEMNKVSWSSRKRLAQDTVVVLVTTLLMALFLLGVDLFWGWLLSRQTVGVLPGKATNTAKAGVVEEAKW